MFNYTVQLTDREMKDLGWFADRGYFPQKMYDAMHLHDNYPEEDGVWVVPGEVAGELDKLLKEYPDAYLCCMGGQLYVKVKNLHDNIRATECTPGRWRVTATRSILGDDGYWSTIQLPTFEIPECVGICSHGRAFSSAMSIVGHNCNIEVVSV